MGQLLQASVPLMEIKAFKSVIILCTMVLVTSKPETKMDSLHIHINSPTRQPLPKTEKPEVGQDYVENSKDYDSGVSPASKDVKTSDPLNHIDYFIPDNVRSAPDRFSDLCLQL